jgi:hypothetical protein
MNEMHQPENSAPVLDLTFPHDWHATVLERRPLIAPASMTSMPHYVYPRAVEEVERGALELIVRPNEDPEFLATFALGFADPAVPTGVWSCPNPQWLCAIAGGYAYLVNTTDPRQWEQVEHRPILAVTALLSQRLLLFSGHQSLMAYGPNGKAWETGRLSWEGIKILDIREATLAGLGWDLMTDTEFKFEVDLRTGEHVGLG